MIIENQNALHLFIGARAAHLLDNEKSLSAETGLSDPGKSLSELRLASGDWPNQRGRYLDLSVAKAFPFHNFHAMQKTTAPRWRMRGTL